MQSLQRSLWLHRYQSAVVLFIACWSLLAAPRAMAQCVGTILPGDGVPGLDENVYAMARLPDGDVLVGGNFRLAGSIPANRIARFDVQTQTWSALGAGLDGQVLAVSVLPNRTFVVGGSFQHAGGIPASNIAMYDPETGAWAALGSGTNGTVSAIVSLPSGQVVAGGTFTMAGGVSANNIARYQPLTGAWSPLGAGASSTVSALTLLQSGEVMVGGLFTSNGGVPAQRLARWTPSTNTWTGMSPGLNGPVYSLAIRSNGDVIVGGNFTTAGGTPANSVARWTPSTGAWAALSAGIGGVQGRSAFALAMMPNDVLFVCGLFNTAGGEDGYASFAGFDFATNSWFGRAPGRMNTVEIDPVQGNRSLLAISGTEVVVGGPYRVAGGVPVSEIAIFNSDTRRWAAFFSEGTNGAVLDIERVSGDSDQVIVGGSFTHLADEAIENTSLHRVSTREWAGINATLPIVGNASSVASMPNGDVYVASAFGFRIGDDPTQHSNYLVRYQASTNTWIPLITGPFFSLNSIRDLATTPDGDLLVAGTFSRINGIDMDGLARYDPDTNSWFPVGGGVLGSGVNVVLPLENGDIVVGGFFFSVGDNINYQHIARYSPSSDTWHPVGTLNGMINCLTRLPDGDIVAGGTFTLPGSIDTIYAARFDQQTGLWSRLGAAVSGDFVYAVAPLPGGDILVGGRFVAMDGVAVNNLARFQVASNTWTPVGSGTNGAVRTLHATGHRVFLGGDFTLVDNRASAYFATLSFCPADVNCDSVANSQDFFDFLTSFFALAPNADFNTDGVVNSQDFFDFLNAFFEGCA